MVKVFIKTVIIPEAAKYIYAQKLVTHHLYIIQPAQISQWYV